MSDLLFGSIRGYQGSLKAQSRSRCPYPLTKRRMDLGALVVPFHNTSSVTLMKSPSEVLKEIKIQHISTLFYFLRKSLTLEVWVSRKRLNATLTILIQSLIRPWHWDFHGRGITFLHTKIIDHFKLDLQVGLSEPHRLGQASDVRICMYEKVPIQIDGEPWVQYPTEIHVSYHKQVPVLKIRPEKSD